MPRQSYYCISPRCILIRWCLVVAAVGVSSPEKAEEEEDKAVMSCVLRVSTWRPARWRATLPGGETAQDAESLDNARLRRGNNNPLLCRVLLFEEEEGSGDVIAHANNREDALVTFATSAAYLTTGKKSKKGETLELWPALVSKAKYAHQHRLDLFLYLSNATLRPGDPARCVDTPSPHYLKILAVLAVLQKNQNRPLYYYRSATYVDADTALNDANLEPADYLDLGGDLIGSSNVNNVPILVNAGVWVARNTRGVRRLLRNWFDRRCGAKDQIALWAALFEKWGLLDAGLREDLFSSGTASASSDYEKARAAVLPAFVANRALDLDNDDGDDPYVLHDQDAYDKEKTKNNTLSLRHERRDGFRCAERCAAILEQTGCLVEPLAVAGVLLLPVVPFAVDGRSSLLPPLQTEHPHPGWWCHKKCPTPSFLDNGTTTIAYNTRRRLSTSVQTTTFLPSASWRGPGGDNTDPCIERGAYICPCGRLAPFLDACSASGQRDPACIARALKTINAHLHHNHFRASRPLRGERERRLLRYQISEEEVGSP